MKSKISRVIGIVFCVLIIGVPNGCSSADNSASSSGIKWYSYKEGTERGKAEKKNVFVNFYAVWCGYCKKMDNDTFKDARVVKYLSENFISVRVDTDKEPNIAREYYVQGLPTAWFLSKSGEKISNMPGYVPSDMFINILKYIQSDKYKEMNFKKFLDTM